MKTRTSRPEAGNKFYITIKRGGWSRCIEGSPRDKNCDVLSNCVGYACGRFNEIIGKMKYPTLNCNAENFVSRAKKLGLKVSNKPTVGGIMVWAKGKVGVSSDGAGHVAVVEKIIDSNTIYTSESSYGGKAFFNATRKNSNGRWGLGSGFTYLGCIVNPSVKEEAVQDKPKLEVYYTVKKGDTLSSIAIKHGTTWKQLQKLNKIANANLIYVGQKIRIK